MATAPPLVWRSNCNLRVPAVPILLLVIAFAVAAVAETGAPMGGEDGGGDPGFQPLLEAPTRHSPPFVLVHLPKCAGTSARNVLSSIMTARGTPSSQLCIPGTPVTPSYTILNVSVCADRAPGPVVLAAGHFHYEWTTQKLASMSEVALPDGANVPCLTFVRPPVERIVSFYYWVYARSNKTAPLLQAMEPEQALHAVRTTALRPFFYHHVPLLILFGNLRRQDLFAHNETAMLEAAERAKGNLVKCIVGSTQAGPATAELLGYYFPWLAERLRPDAMPHLNQRRREDSPERAPLPRESATLIREHYRVEMDLYDFAMEVHQAQVGRVRALQQLEARPESGA